MKAIHQVLIAEFYRRNALFFLLGLIFLVFVCRPPSLLVSPWFILPMLESTLFFGIVSGLIFLYYLKCWADMWRGIHQRGHAFLYILRTLSPIRLCVRMSIELLGTMGPGFLYILVVAAYSVYTQTWHVWAIFGVHVVFFVVASLHLSHAIRYPREIVPRHGWQAWLEARFRKSWVFIALQTLISSHLLASVFSKVVIWTLLLMTLSGYQAEMFSNKGLKLIFLSLAALQVLYAYWLRSAEDRPIFVMRNLPIPWSKRWLAYFWTGIILFLPEALFWMTANFQGLAAAGSESLVYLMMGLSFFLLGISLLYYRPFPMVDFLKHIGLVYLLFFVSILFQVPIWLPLGISIGLSLMIFGEEFHKWNGF